MSTEPTLWGLAASGILVAVAVGLSMWRRLGLERSMLWAALRALVQLMLIGLALELVIDPSRPIAYSWLWVGIMLLFAAWTSRRRAPEVPGGFTLSLGAYSASCVISLGVLFGF